MPMVLTSLYVYGVPAGEFSSRHGETARVAWRHLRVVSYYGRGIWWSSNQRTWIGHAGRIPKTSSR